MATEAGCYSVSEKDKFYELGQAMVEVANIQRALRQAQRSLELAKTCGNLDAVARRSFDCGRLAQALHDLRDRYNLEIRIQEIFASNDKETREGFEAVRLPNG